MLHLTPLQREVLEKIGVEIWQERRPEPETEQSVEDLVLTADLGDAESVCQTEQITPTQNPGLDEISAVIKSCAQCELCKTRTHAVPGTGHREADWMFVGEAPGQNEDEQGLPFVGRAGKLLDAMIAALGMSREETFIANVIKCRPPGNRDPLPEEVAACEPYLHQQLDLVRPRVIIALGRISAQALLKTTEPLGKMRGRVYQYGQHATPLVVTYHPAYLLRSPEQKHKTWQDLLLARSLVRESV